MRPPNARGYPFWLLLAWICYGLIAPWWARTAAGWRDGPEFVVSAQSLGIAHPAGFPLYSAWGWFVQQLLPFGDITMRNHLSNACLTLAAAVMLYELARAFSRFCDSDVARAGADRHLAGFVSLLWLLLPPQWENAIQAEVYALFALFVFGILRLLLAYWQKGEERLYLVAAFLAGLGCGAHATVGFLIFAFAAFLAAGRELGPTLRLAAKAFFAGLAGLAVYAYLPLRSLRDPVMDWGDTERLAGFLRHVTDQKDAGTRFHHLLADHMDSSYNLLHLFWNISEWFGPVLLLLSVAGWGVLLYRKFWPGLGLLLWLCFSFSFFAGWISGTVLTACLGVLMFGMMPWMAEATRWPRPVAIMFMLLIAGSGLVYATNAGTEFLATRSDHLSRGLIADELFELPYRATLLSGPSWFHVQSLTNIEGMRPDVSVLFLGEVFYPRHFRSIRLRDLALLQPVSIQFSQSKPPTAEAAFAFLSRLKKANIGRTRFFVDPDDSPAMRLLYPSIHPYKRLWLRWGEASSRDVCALWGKTTLDAMADLFREKAALLDNETSDILVPSYFGRISAMIEERPQCPRMAMRLMFWWGKWMKQTTINQGTMLNNLGIAFSQMGAPHAARTSFLLSAQLGNPKGMLNLGLWYVRRGNTRLARKWLAMALKAGLKVHYRRGHAQPAQQAGKE